MEEEDTLPWALEVRVVDQHCQLQGTALGDGKAPVENQLCGWDTVMTSCSVLDQCPVPPRAFPQLCTLHVHTHVQTCTFMHFCIDNRPGRWC